MKTVIGEQSHGRFRWLCLTFLAFCLALGGSWIALASIDFGYQYLYGLIGIDAHIMKYAPMNQLKMGFELSSDAERYRLFSDIVTAIHQQGQGLASLAYGNQGSRQLLLTQDELLHLQDVATLISYLAWVLLLILLLFMGLLIWLYRTGQSMPSFKVLLFWSLLVLLFLVGLVFALGPHNVFNQLHIWAFPVENKWFFYYEESLMSTLMKAPDLFAYIAVMLVLLALPLFILLMWLLKKLFTGRAL